MNKIHANAIDAPDNAVKISPLLSSLFVRTTLVCDVLGKLRYLLLRGVTDDIDGDRSNGMLCSELTAADVEASPRKLLTVPVADLLPSVVEGSVRCQASSILS